MNLLLLGTVCVICRQGLAPRNCFDIRLRRWKSLRVISLLLVTLFFVIVFVVDMVKTVSVRIRIYLFFVCSIVDTCIITVVTIISNIIVINKILCLLLP